VSLSLPRRVLAEFLGTMTLVACIIGSGIAAQTLSPGNSGLQLLINMVAIGSILFVLITVLGPVSGAQMNPVVTAVDSWFGGLARRDIVPYIVAQVLGACAGAILANIIFGLPSVTLSVHTREGFPLLLSEAVSTVGLLVVIFGLVRSARSAWIPGAVALYIVAAAWFTPSTSFANPAVAVGRTLSDSFAGIAPASVPGFFVAEIVGAVIGVAIVVTLWPTPSASSSDSIDVQLETR